MLNPDENLPIEYVTSDIIRQFFNDNQYYERMKSGEIVTKIRGERHPDTPPPGEPYCTRSQILFYQDHNGELLAIVHQYLRRDGSLGASGLPDPKKIYLPDRILAVRVKSGAS